MVNISIDVTDLGGEARPGDKVIFWRPRVGGSATHAGRVISTAPVDVFLTNGKASVPDVEPGSMRVLLQCRGVESQGPIDVTVPDGTGTVTLRSLIESQFEYAPPIVSAVQEAAANASASERAAIEAQVRSEAAADRADARVDDAINNGANLIRAEVKQDADRAVAARQAATQSESNAKASESAAATSESNAATSESAAKQSETNAGDFAAVATTAATEAVDAMDSVADIIGAKYATQEYVDASKWYRGNAGASNTLDSLAEGSWNIAGGSVAESLGLPRVSTGSLMISRMNSGVGKTAIFVTSTHTRDSPEVWVNATSNSGGWGEWVNLSAGFEPSTKQAAVPLTFPRGSSYSDDRPTLTMRIPFKFGAAVKRMRLRLRNYDYRSDHGFPGSYRIVGAGIGKHQINPDGSMTGLIPDGEPVIQLMSSTQMTGPNEARGNWVEVDLEANTDYLLSYSFTADDGMVYTRQTAQCFTSRIMQGWNKTGVTTATPSSMAVLSAILDVEVLDDVPIYGYLGDSQTAAISAERPGYDSWAMVHSRMSGAIPTIHGHGGAGLSEWQDETKPAYSISDGLARFDRMYISMGSNDISNGRPFTGVQDYLTTVMKNWRKQTSTFVLHNYLPRTSPQDSDTVRRELNDWIRSSLPSGALHTVDIWEATVDPATGLMDERWRASTNDVHMASAGNARVAMATLGGVMREPVGGVLEAYNLGKGAQ